MDAIEFLKRDHAKVTELFHRLNDGGGLTGVVKRLTGNTMSPRQRRTVATQICDDLDTHAAIEESIFYPAVRALRDEKLSQLLDESLREHGTIKERVAAARGAMDDEERLREPMSSLQQCVDHHVREEENEMFPLLEDRMPAEERATLGRELAARKKSGRATSASREGRSARGRTSAGGRATSARKKAPAASRARRKTVKRTTGTAPAARERRRVRKTTGKGSKGRTGGGKRRAGRR